jgi:hypothetical protein
VAGLRRHGPLSGSNLGPTSEMADDSGTIGKGYADWRDLTWEEPESGSFGNWYVIASDLEVDPASDMIQKSTTGGDQFETSPAADQHMNCWGTDGREDRGVRPDRAHGTHEHEAKEHDLPLVRQRRA